MGEVDRLPYKSLLQIVDVPIQYMFRYTNSDERCKHSAEEELSIAEKIPLKGTRRREKKTGFRVELRTKSNFKSNARGKLRQTIYFFWP